MTWSRSEIGRGARALAATRLGSLIVLIVLLVLGLARTRAARAADTFAWTPGDAPAVARGREVAARFDLRDLVELSVEVDNAFSATNRAALATAEDRLGAVPGVRRVFGPANLLDISVDGAGKPSAHAVLARGSRESDGEEARQRVVRRADALGWFVSANGRLVRFLLAASVDDLPRLRPQLMAALLASGLGLVPAPVGDGLTLRPLMPDPRARDAPTLPAGLVALAVLFILVAGFKARPLKGRYSAHARLAVAVGAAAGAAAPFVAVPVTGVRVVGALAAGAAAGMVLLGFAFERWRPVPPGGWNVFARPPMLVVVLALAPIVAFLVLAPRLRVGTHQWNAAPLLFVDVRADLDQPAVLHEVERLTEHLRAQPGVASAWSVADLFMGVENEGQDASRIPPDAEVARDVLGQARSDPAVALELAADHHEGLVVVRFDDDETGAEAVGSRLALMDDLAAYVAGDLRTWLLPIDLRTPELPAVARGLAKGLLASDTAVRVLGISERSGRSLTPKQALAVEHAARQAASLPVADPERLHAELVADARDFVVHYPVALRASEQNRLVEALAALGDEATVGDVTAAVAGVYGARVSERMRVDTGGILARRLASVRWRHTARINFQQMLTGAELPTDGVLADEVRSATLEGMGPVVGVPVAPGSPGALRVDVAAVGGAANDRALSDAWFEGVRWGVAGLVGLWALLLALVGGARAMLWLPVGAAPGATAMLAAAILREPLGLWGLALLAGALASGGVLAVAFAARRSA